MISPASGPSRAGKVVLLVEDEILVRLIAAEYLREAGYVVVEVSSADEALEYLRTSNEVSLIFSDVRMPGSLNGLQLAERVTLLYPGLPIILASGHLLGDETAETPLFSKPYFLDEVVAKISSLIGEPGTGDQSQERA